MSLLSTSYDSGEFFDEMYATGGEVRPHYRRLAERLGTLDLAEFDRRRAAVDLAFLRRGVTFTVYNDSEGTERIFPFDLIPRIIPAQEWARIEAGLIQRITALNLFLHDLYHEQKILKDKVVPAAQILTRQAFPAGVHELLRAAGHLRAHLRHRPDPRQGRATTSCWRTTCAAPPASRT